MLLGLVEKNSAQLGRYALPLALASVFGGVVVNAIRIGARPSRKRIKMLAQKYKIAPSKATEIALVANRIGANPEHLIRLINFESGGTFSTSARNEASGATGLIQFMPRTARRLGTTTEALSKMSFKEQMRYAEAYFSIVKSGNWDDRQSGPLDTQQRLYMAVFYPFYRETSVSRPFPANVQQWNPGVTSPESYIRKVNNFAEQRIRG